MLKSSRHSRGFPFSASSVNPSIKPESSTNIISTSLSSFSTPTVNIFIPTHLFSVIKSGTKSGLLFGYEQANGNLVHINITALLPADEEHLGQLIKRQKDIINKKEENDEVGPSDSDDPIPQHYRPKFTNSVAAKTSSSLLKKKTKIHFLGELVEVLSSDKENVNKERKKLTQRHDDQLSEFRRLWKHEEQHFKLMLNFDAALWPPSLTATTFDNRHPIPYQTLSLASIEQRLSDDHFRSIDVGQVTILYYDTSNFMSSQLLNRFNTEDER